MTVQVLGFGGRAYGVEFRQQTILLMLSYLRIVNQTTLRAQDEFSFEV